jgi:hypothetical protein
VVLYAAPQDGATPTEPRSVDLGVAGQKQLTKIARHFAVTKPHEPAWIKLDQHGVLSQVGGLWWTPVDLLVHSAGLLVRVQPGAHRTWATSTSARLVLEDVYRL